MSLWKKEAAGILSTAIYFTSLQIRTIQQNLMTFWLRACHHLCFLGTIGFLKLRNITNSPKHMLWSHSSNPGVHLSFRYLNSRPNISNDKPDLNSWNASNFMRNHTWGLLPDSLQRKCDSRGGEVFLSAKFSNRGTGNPHLPSFL